MVWWSPFHFFFCYHVIYIRFSLLTVVNNPCRRICEAHMDSPRPNQNLHTQWSGIVLMSVCLRGLDTLLLGFIIYWWIPFYPSLIVLFKKNVLYLFTSTQKYYKCVPTLQKYTFFYLCVVFLFRIVTSISLKRKVFLDMMGWFFSSSFS